jgi:Ca2+-binding RTX toxin-like protein
MTTIHGSNRSETVKGTNDSDTIYGYDGNDDIFGWGGDDYIFGGAGADHIDGGDGIHDTVTYLDSDVGVAVSLATGQGFGGTAEYDTLTNVENLSGSWSADYLVGNDVDNVLNGWGGNDVLYGGGGDDTLYGFYGHDTLKGGGGSDTLVGDSGNDWLDGGEGDDYMVGGIGDDIYFVDSAFDIVVEDEFFDGTDTVYSTSFAYYLSDFTNVEILSLDTAAGTGVYATGNSQHNTIFGNANDNVLDGGGAGDILSGLGGNDTFVFHAGQAHGDVVYEFDGNGAAEGDQLQFYGYGPGATFTQASATEWIIASADGSVSEVITLIGAPAVDPSDYHFL